MSPGADQATGPLCACSVHVAFRARIAFPGETSPARQRPADASAGGHQLGVLLELIEAGHDEGAAGAHARGTRCRVEWQSRRRPMSSVPASTTCGQTPATTSVALRAGKTR